MVFLVKIIALIAMSLFLSVQGLQARFGSQPACNKSLNFTTALVGSEIVIGFAAPWALAIADLAIQWFSGIMKR